MLSVEICEFLHILKGLGGYQTKSKHRREALATMICSYLSRTFCLLFAYFKADMKSLVRFCDVCVDWLGDIASSSVNLLGEGIVPLVLCLCLCSVISLKQFLILFLFL